MPGSHPFCCVGTSADHDRRFYQLPHHRHGVAGAAIACASGPRLEHICGWPCCRQSVRGRASFSRVVGPHADSRGAKRAVIAGLLAAVVGGLFYLLSLRFAGCRTSPPASSLLGRALLGAAESFIITGGVSWGLVLAGPASAGKVIAWVGMAMFAALASGAPVGTALYSLGGFTSIAIATALVPLATILLVVPLAPIAPQRGTRSHFLKVAKAVGCRIGSALSSIGFGTIIAFSSLLSRPAQLGIPVWLLFSAFATSSSPPAFSWATCPTGTVGPKLR